MPLSLGLGLRVARPGAGPKHYAGTDLNFSRGWFADRGPYRTTPPANFTFSRTGAGTALKD